MINRIHNRLGTAGFVVAIVALVAALSGVAIAANGGLSGKQKKEVKKIAKQFAGKNGAPGAKGDPGAPGAPGVDGEDGVCSAGIPECVTPSNATLTGNWAFSTPGGAEKGYTAISLPLQANPELEFTPTSHIVFNGLAVESDAEREATAGEPRPWDTTHCPGTPADPKALPGYLCVYASEAVNISNFGFKQPVFPTGEETADLDSGAILTWNFANEANPAYARGSWAYTAE